MHKMDFHSQLHINFLKDINYNYRQESSVIIDLVTIMGNIYYEDVNTPKPGGKARIIEMIVPVFNCSLWQKNRQTIEQLVNWVSGEIFKFTFIESSYRNDEYNNNLLPPNGRDVTLFSGGLDSLSGAYHNYKAGIISDYVGFVNKGEERTKQIEVSNFYKKVFKGSSDIILIDKPIDKKKTLIQSTRSLLYLSLAIATAYFNNSKNVYLYENGILSLNPELKNRYTTKTTHPKTIYLYSLLLEKANINININHPFLFKTKGQIINEMDITFKKVIKDTFTCGQGRSQTKSHKGQCGICVPCLLRKISLAAYNNEEYDVSYQYNYQTKILEVKNDSYRKDYASNLEYFRSYYKAIKDGTISLEIHTRAKYYKGTTNFRMSNDEMFRDFAHEYERYINRYDPY